MSVYICIYLRKFFIYLRECSYLLFKLMSVSLVTARQQSETWSVQSFAESWRLAACQSHHGQTSWILCDFPPSYSPGNVCLDSFPHWTHIQGVSIVHNTILFCLFFSWFAKLTHYKTSCTIYLFTLLFEIR